jgi:hypothetical protein
MAYAARTTDVDELEATRLQLPALAAQMPDGLQSLSPEQPLEAVLAALWRDGAVVLEHAVSDTCADRVVAEMTLYMDALSKGDAFTGENTKRAGAVVGRSPASWEIVAHPMLLQVCEAVIGRQVLNQTPEGLSKTLYHDSTPGSTDSRRALRRSHGFQCHLHQIIKIGPDSPAQPIHRDEAAFAVNFQRQMEIEVSTIWALNDFTPDIGPTRVVRARALLLLLCQPALFAADIIFYAGCCCL